MLIEIYFLI